MMRVTERPLFHDPDSFMTVRHLTMHGTNFEIGRRLGELAIGRHGNPRLTM